MKRVIILITMVVLHQTVLAQNTEKCQKIVDIVITSINDNSAEPLQPYLAENFSIAGQKGELARMVLDQLFAQLTVNSFQETHRRAIDHGLELKYNIVYEKMGAKEATFLFDKDGLLSNLNLFKMEVKTMATQTPKETGSKKIVKIPFKMAEKLILTEVMLNGVKRKFILDTGAPMVILNAKYTASKKRQMAVSSSQGAAGTISGMNIEKVKSLAWGDIKLVDQEFITLDLAHLEDELKTEIYGLIGYDMVMAYDLIFDYEKQFLTLIKPKAYKDYENENFADRTLVKVPFELQQHIPAIKAEISGMSLTLGIDSGAGSNFIDEGMFTTLKNAMSKVRNDYVIGADNHKKDTKKAEIRNIKIGEKSFAEVSTQFSDISHLNKEGKLNIDGLIGYPILSQQKTILSYNRKELVFVQ